MPQADGDTLVCRGGSGGDGRSQVTCETLLSADVPPDFPAESFCLSKQDELDWFDRNVFYERKESTKGNSNSNPNSNSQRFSFSSNLKSKPSIIGLPKKPETSVFHDSKMRRTVKPGNTRFFPKRLGSAAKFSLRLTEPSSPTVSCMGRVRSKNRFRSTSKPEKTGFWCSIKKALWFTCRKSHAVDGDDPPEKSPPRKSVTGEKRRPSTEDQGNPPGLGGLNRFVSGRRSDSWAGDVVDLESAGGDSSDLTKVV